jgi:hypothetical protein
VYKRSAVAANAIVGKECVEPVTYCADHLADIQSYLSALEDRLEKVEQRLNRVENNNHDAIEVQVGSSQDPRQNRVEGYENEASLGGGNNAFLIPDEDEQDGNAEDGSTDGMGAMVFADEENSGFFGSYTSPISSRS